MINDRREISCSNCFYVRFTVIINNVLVPNAVINARDHWTKLDDDDLRYGAMTICIRLHTVCFVIYNIIIMYVYTAKKKKTPDADTDDYILLWFLFFV